VHPEQPKLATTHTKVHNRNAANRDFDPVDLERVRKGFIAKRQNGLISDEKGRFVGNSDNYEVLRD
jgi:alkyl sulfatase BDS1-like metallo-beta-lactamase superfamily hydrolase